MNAARKLFVAEVNVPVTYGVRATLAAISETKGMPIIFTGVYDPNAGRRLGQNVAGISSKSPMTSLLTYFNKPMPFTRLAII